MDSSVLVVVPAVLVVIGILRWLTSSRNYPPGPTGLPILGYIPFLSRKPFLDFEKLARKYGNVFRIQLGSLEIVVINDFESTKEAFTQDKFIGRPPESPFSLNKETIETMVFWGISWKEQHGFSLRSLKDLALGKSNTRLMEEEIRNFLQHLEQNTDKLFKVSDVLLTSTINNIASLVFGRRFEYDDPACQMMNKSLKDTSKEAGKAMWQILFPRVRKIVKFLHIVDVDKISRTQEDFRCFIMEEINEHQKTLNPSNVRDFIDDYLLEIERRESDPKFSKPILQDLLCGFFGAGMETGRLIIEWLLLTAASKQDAQRGIQREIDDVVGQDNLPLWSNHTSMPYTEAFIMEVTRWRTVVPVNFFRYALEDGEIGGYTIPKNSYITSNTWAIHHNPEYWGADADDFRPERFLTEDGKEVKKMEHYILFSIGHRHCPAELFSTIEIFLYFTSILQRFNVRLPEGKEADFEGELGIGYMPKPQDLIFTKRTTEDRIFTKRIMQ